MREEVKDEIFEGVKSSYSGVFSSGNTTVFVNISIIKINFFIFSNLLNYFLMLKTDQKKKILLF